MMPKKVAKKPVAKPKKGKKGAFNDDDTPAEKKASHDDQDDYDLSKEDYEDKMKKSEKEEDVYTEEGRELLEEDDEIEDWEAGFSKGAQPDKHHKK